MPEVILPVLDEAAAIPGVLAALPPGYRAIVVDNGSSDGSGELAAALGGEGCRANRAAASARPATRVSRPPRARSSASWTATGRSTPASCPRWSRCSRAARPTSFSAAAGRAGAPGRCMRALANMALAAVLRRRTGLALRDLGPMRAARRTELLELGPDRPSLRLSAGDGRPRRGRGLARAASCPSPIAASRAARRSRAPCAARCAPSAT